MMYRGNHTGLTFSIASSALDSGSDYVHAGMAPPSVLVTHSTRAMATTWALLRGVPLQDVCAAPG